LSRGHRIYGMRHLGTLLWILLVLPSWAAGENESRLEVSHLARSLQPGEAVLIRAQSAVPLGSMQVKAFGKAFLFYSTEDGRVWEGLVGIDLETTPDDYSLSLTGSTVAGVPVEATYPLRVLDKEFPTRRLTVEEKFVNPPQQELERIRRESKRVRENREQQIRVPDVGDGEQGKRWMWLQKEQHLAVKGWFCRATGCNIIG